jgi:HEAT repeat protein
MEGAEMEPRWLEGLKTQLDDQDAATRQRARETLTAIGEPAVPALVDLLGSPSARLRWEAAKAFTELPEPAAIPALVQLLADRQSEIGWLAAVALINLGSRSIPFVLQGLNEHAESKRFRSAAHHVLHDLSARNAVMRDILRPVLDVLDEVASDAGVISSRAEEALHGLRALGEG